VHRHVNINEDGVLASSEAELTRKLHLILLCKAVGKNICRVDVPADENR
jgi:hypothetical protein